MRHNEQSSIKVTPVGKGIARKPTYCGPQGGRWDSRVLHSSNPTMIYRTRVVTSQIELDGTTNVRNGENAKCVICKTLFEITSGIVQPGSRVVYEK